MPVQDRVGVATLLESPACRVQPHHLVGPPSEVVVVVSVFHPVDSHIGTPVDRIADRVSPSREPQVLEFPGRHPAAPGKTPRTGHAAAVEVVSLVPPVVGHLVARLGVDQRVEHAAGPDRMAGVQVVGRCHGASYGWSDFPSVEPAPVRCKPADRAAQRGSMRMEAVARPTRPPRS